MAFPQQYGNLTTHGSNLASALRYKPFQVGSFVTNTLAYPQILASSSLLSQSVKESSLGDLTKTFRFRSPSFDIPYSGASLGWVSECKDIYYLNTLVRNQ